MSNIEKIGTANGFSKSCTVYQAVMKLLVKRPSLVQWGNARIVLPFCLQFLRSNWSLCNCDLIEGAVCCALVPDQTLPASIIRIKHLEDSFSGYSITNGVILRFMVFAMDDKSNKLLLVPVLTVLFVMIGYQYICPAGSTSCRFGNGESFPFSKYPSDVNTESPDPDEDASFRFQSKFNFTRDDLERHVDFDIKGNDVIVFLHIQKTGGTTFGRHLVRNIHLERPCDCRSGQKKCTCHRPGKAESWLFSRFSTGWSCGLHADWTELTNCVPAVMNKKQKKDAPLNGR